MIASPLRHRLITRRHCGLSLCALAAVLTAVWIATYDRGVAYGVYTRRPGDILSVRLAGGAVVVWYSTRENGLHPSIGFETASNLTTPWLWRPIRSWESVSVLVAMPVWIAVVPIALVGGVLARRRVNTARCACGYDLRGLISGICPECGATLPAARR